jgi:ABC-2 type transport system ATP-binding protein
VSAVLSSHVLSEIEDVADHVLVLGNGSVLFSDSVSRSLAEHRTIEDPKDLGGADLVGQFPGRKGAVHSLVAAASGLGRSPTLEEVVLGYLASARLAEREWSQAADEDSS